MVLRKTRRLPDRKTRPSAKRKTPIAAIRFSGAFRVVPTKNGNTLEIYQSRDEAIAAGVSEQIATELFSDVRVAWCWAHIDQQSKLVRCEKRSLNGETCEGECHR